MRRIGRRIPSTAALLAFETAAKHLNFSRAAAELNTSQSAISRHVSGLEARIGSRLFERLGTRVKLTEAGETFLSGTTAGLDSLKSAVSQIVAAGDHSEFTIACSHEVSHLFLMPRYEAVCSAVGIDVRLRIMTLEYDFFGEDLDPRIDLFFAYQPEHFSENRKKMVFQEEISLLCSPGYLSTLADPDLKASDSWLNLTLLELTKANRGWASWHDWFDHHNLDCETVSRSSFDNYVYLLEAATAGKGIMLGWKGLVERYLEDGTLIQLPFKPIAFDRGLYALLTERGAAHPSGQRLLEFLGEA